jgi:hypothetical protein
MQAPDTDPPDTALFPRFGELPKEIQIKIWRHAASNLRTIVVDHRVSRNPNGTIRSYEEGKEPYDITSPITPPLMQVCYEARKAAKDLYDTANLRKGTKFYMNQDVDILYLKGSMCFRGHLKGRVKRAERQHTHYFSWLGVRYLAFDLDILSRRSGCELYISEIVRKFFTSEKRVDKIYVVYQKPEDLAHAMRVAGIWSVDHRAFLRYNTSYLKRLIDYPIRRGPAEEPFHVVRRDGTKTRWDDYYDPAEEDDDPKFRSDHERWKAPEWIPILISELPAS